MGNVAEEALDRRARRSRRLIVEAFERLLAAQPYERISVSAIAREADVDRKTFYQHFGSIDGLLDAIAEGLAARVLDEVERIAPRPVGAEERERAMHVFFTALVQTLSERIERDRTYAARVPAEILYGHLSRAFERQIAERGLLEGIVPARERASCLAYVLGGLFALLRRWVLDGCDRPAAEVARIVATLTEFGLRGIVEGCGEGADACGEAPACAASGE